MQITREIEGLVGSIFDPVGILQDESAVSTTDELAHFYNTTQQLRFKYEKTGNVIAGSCDVRTVEKVVDGIDRIQPGEGKK